MKRSIRNAIFLITLMATAALYTGCGYRVAGGPSSASGPMPGDIKSISIPYFTNQTRRAGIERILTESVIDEFMAVTKVSRKGPAEAVLRGEVKTYKLVPVSYSSTDVVSEYRIEITLSIKIIRDSDGKTLWEDSYIYDEDDFPVDESSVAFTKSAELDAFRSMSRDTARLIRDRVIEGF